MRHVGIWSFSLYLWQGPPVFLLEWYSAPLILVGVFAMALMSFYLIERPARTMLNRFYDRQFTQLGRLLISQKP